MTDGTVRIAVTGAAGYIAGSLIRSLVRDSSVERVLATDIREPGSPFGPKAVFVRHDVTEPMDDILSEHGVNAVVHLAFVLQTGHDRHAARRVNVDGAATVVKSCVEAGVRRLLYLGSTTVYGAHADNPALLTEDSPVRPVAGFQYGEDKADVERLFSRLEAEYRGLSLTVLRVCPVVGPNADNFIARAFSKPLLVAVGDHDPEMQLLHEDDLVELMRLCLRRDSPGVFNVAGRSTVRWSEMARIMGRRLVRLPAWTLYPLTEIAWRLRLQRDSPACGLDFIRHPWTADTGKLADELGFEPRHSSTEAWLAFARRREPAAAGEAAGG